MGSVTYEIDREHRLVRIRMRGALRSQDLLAVTSAMRSDADLNPEWGVLVDTREMTEAPRYNEMQQLVDIARKSPMRADSRRVFLVSSTVMYGAARMASTLAGEYGRQYLVCREEADALRWIADGPEAG